MVANPQFNFCRRADGVRFTFPEQEWNCLSKLFTMLEECAEIRPMFERLSLEYGEV